MLAQDNPTLVDESRVILPGEGTKIPANGDEMFIKVRGSDTGGAWAMVQAVIPPMSFGPPLHINSREDEVFYVLEGALRMQLGERIVTATAGTITFVPKGSVHTFCNPFNEPAAILGIISPAGFEHYFEEVATLMQESLDLTHEERMSKHAALIARYGGILVGPPMTLETGNGR